MRKLLIILFSAFSFTVFAEDVVIALLQPLTVQGSTDCDPFEVSMVRGELRKELGRHTGYQVVTRLDVDAILKEMGFQQSGMVNDAQRKRVGAMTGAQYICVSTITRYSTQLYIEAYLVNVETGQMTNPVTQYAKIINDDYSTVRTSCNAMANEMLGELGENITSKIVISKQLLQERGFRFPNAQREATVIIFTSKGYVNLKCDDAFARELEYAWCIGTTSNEDCYVDGLSLFQRRDSTFFLGYVACGSMAYPYMVFWKDGNHFYVGVQEIRCSYGCANHPDWDSSDKRTFCVDFKKIFGRDVTTIDFIQKVISGQIDLPNLQKKFENFLKEGGSIHLSEYNK